MSDVCTGRVGNLAYFANKPYDVLCLVFQHEDAIRKNHVVTTGGDSVADTWKVERPKSLDLSQDTSYFRAKTLVSLRVIQ